MATVLAPIDDSFSDASMALQCPSDVWREIILSVRSHVDLMSLLSAHPSFGELMHDRLFLQQWLNLALPKIRYEFGDIGVPYSYGDWTLRYLCHRFPDCTLRFKITSLLSKGCNASVIRHAKPERCGLKGAFSSREEATFPFDLLQAHGWKVCRSCLNSLIITLEDSSSISYLSTFSKIFPAKESSILKVLPIRHFRHTDRCYSYYLMSEVDEFIFKTSSGLFSNFSSWKAGVLAKRGSTSELQISALLHSARGLALPGGPGRTQIALEIAYQSIKEYEHRMNQFVLAKHPDLPRLGLSL